MKPQALATLVIVALVGAMTVVATRLAFMGDVSPEDFAAFVRDHAASHIEAQQTLGASPLPLLVSIRFPMTKSEGALGFPDRTDVYTIASTSGEFECQAHVRRDRVCLVTFERSAPPSGFREHLVKKFPKLSIR